MWHEVLTLGTTLACVTSAVGGIGMLVYDTVRQHDRGISDHQWIVLSESIIGTSHQQTVPPLPCQDAHQVQVLNEHCGIAVVCDGLGSKRLSHIGSRLAAKKAAEYLAKHFKNRLTQQTWPDNHEWRNIAFDTSYRIYRYLLGYSKIHGYAPNQLGTTLIMCVYSPWGIVSAHIGDGRAGYRKNGKWHSMMTPMRDADGSTMPVTGNFWQDKALVGKYIETQCIKGDIEAFVLMSDGCENFSYETYTKKGHVNRPYAPFFDPLIEYIINRYKDKGDLRDIRLDFKRFLVDGNDLIKKETDDKTMVLGILSREESCEESRYEEC